MRSVVPIFSQLHQPNKPTYTYNTLIKSHLSNPHPNPQTAFELFIKMKRNGTNTDNYTYPIVLKACKMIRGLREGKQVHAEAIKVGVFESDVFVRNGLIGLYSKCRQMRCSRAVFDWFGEKDLVSWNLMVTGYVECGDMVDAQKVFDEMPERSLVSWTALVCGYAKHGDMENAITWFDRMDKKDTAAFNAMIDAYVKVGDMSRASSLFNEMPNKNVVSWTSMVDGYCRHGNVFMARTLFDSMPHKNLVSWNAMIKGYYQNKQPNEALKLFQELQLEVSLEPDNVTIVSVLPAIADLGALDLGNWVHEFIIRKKMNRATNVCTALVDMYAKCGEFSKARKVFDSMTTKETATWNALIHGLAVNGYGKEAIDVFLDMTKSKVKPNEITMTAVLTACNHSGLVEEGKRWFKSMQDFGIVPKIEHYGCMIDILGRAGCLEEAEKIMDDMPYEVNDIILSSVLSACGYAKDVKRAERILNKSGEKGGYNDGNCITLRNLYAQDRRWVDVEEVLGVMRSNNTRKEVGCSVVEVGGQVWGFASGDRFHPQWLTIKSMLEVLLIHMKKEIMFDLH